MTKNISSAFNRGRHLSVALIGCFLFVASLAAPEHETRASGIAAQQRPTSAKALLDLGNFYYSTDDTSDIAAKQYKLVIAQYPNSKEAEAAQYFLGSYYHRKFYIRKEKWRSEYKYSLVQAESEYKRYINKYSNSRSPEWLCDARFNISLAHMEQENFASAIDQLQTIILFDAQRDPSIYVHQVIWSEDPKAVIDQGFNAKQLAEYARYLANMHQSGRGIEAIVGYLGEWCKGQKNQQNAK